jgi:hypothetical protein
VDGLADQLMRALYVRYSPVQGALIALDADCPYTEYLAPLSTNSAGQALLKGVKQANFGVFCARNPSNKCSWVGIAAHQQQTPTTYITKVREAT